MAEKIIKRITVLIIVGNIEVLGPTISKADTNTVQTYSYFCAKTRNAWGRPYGNPFSNHMEIKIRNFSEKFEANLLKDIKSMQATDYSLLFNAEFDFNQRLINFDDCMVVSGFPVDIEEEISSSDLTASQLEGQRVLTLKLLLSSISYLSDNHLNLQLIKS